MGIELHHIYKSTHSQPASYKHWEICQAYITFCKLSIIDVYNNGHDSSSYIRAAHTYCWTFANSKPQFQKGSQQFKCIPTTATCFTMWWDAAITSSTNNINTFHRFVQPSGLPLRSTHSHCYYYKMVWITRACKHNEIFKLIYNSVPTTGLVHINDCSN